jgi:hypothetical protein
MVGKPILLEADDGKKKGNTCQKKNSLQPGRKTGDYRRYFPERNSNFHEFKAKKSIRFNQIRWINKTISSQNSSNIGIAIHKAPAEYLQLLESHA